MDIVKIADLKNNLSRYLARVRRGREITVYDRNVPIARIVPLVHGAADHGSSASAADEHVAHLVRDGIVGPGNPRAFAEWLDAHPPVRLPEAAPSAVDLLLEMRRQSSR